MSDKDSSTTGGRNGQEKLSMNRRRMLQLTGMGVGGLAMGGLSGVGGAQTSSCAEGPYERTYEPGTINLGKIQSVQSQSIGHGTDLGAASPHSEHRGEPDTSQPSREGVQAAHWDENDGLTIHTEYDGVNSQETRGGVPSDSQVAVGERKLIHALNQQVAIYDKESGKRQQMVNLERIWEPVIDEPEGGFTDGVPLVFDPRARYDRGMGRFVLCATQFQAGITESGEIIDREDLEEGVEFGEESTETASQAQQVSRPPRGWFLVAVSATSNPSGKWHVYRIPPLENRGLVDYPTLGLDREAVYMTQNFFPRVDSLEFDVTMVTLDKEAMYEGEDVTAHHFNRMNDPNSDGFTFTVQPALQPFSGGHHDDRGHDEDDRDAYYMVNSDFPEPTSGTLSLWELTDPLDDPSLECFTLDVDPYASPPNARQPGTDSLLDTLGTRVMNADYDRGSLWTAHTLAHDWNGDGTPVAAIRWYEIDVDDREVVQSGVYGEPGKSYFIPTVGADHGTAVISHNVAGPDTYAQANVAGRTAFHTPGEMEDSVVVEEGKSRYDALEGDVERWGDYNGVSVDPGSGTFWTVSQYSPDVDIPVSKDERDPYFTRIAEVSFGEWFGRGDGRGGDEDGRGRGDGDGRGRGGDGGGRDDGRGGRDDERQRPGP